MRTHADIGVEVVSAAFGCEALTYFVATHHAQYGRAQPGLPAGEDIPLPARLIAIADAFDAMTADRPYRGRMSRGRAFAELRRCAGVQFDPALVERFIAAVEKSEPPRPQQGDGCGDRMLGDTPLSGELQRVVDASASRDMAGLRAIVNGAGPTTHSRTTELLRRLEGLTETDADLAQMHAVVRELLVLCSTSDGASVGGEVQAAGERESV